jgi:hypothetical protein
MSRNGETKIMRGNPNQDKIGSQPIQLEGWQAGITLLVSLTLRIGSESCYNSKPSNLRRS